MSTNKERATLNHEVMTKVVFTIELKNGNEIDVYAQRHRLVEIYEWYQDGTWYEADDVSVIDEFFLTGYDEGYLFNEDDIGDLFETDMYDWEFTGGFGSDASDISEESDLKEQKKKWEAYKSQFPKATSKEQFQII